MTCVFSYKKGIEYIYAFYSATCLLNVTSSNIGRHVICTKLRHQNLARRYFATASQRQATRCQFCNFVKFIAKTEEFVVFMYVYNKNIITLVTLSDGSDHVSWLRQELLEHTRLRLV